MAFRTRIDYSNNRQIKQREQTSTSLVGRTDFGLPFSGLSSGVDLTTSATTAIYENVISTFIGDLISTTFNFGIPQMSGGEAYLNTITPVNSNDNQEVEPYFIGINPSINPTFGNTVYASYTGSSFDFEITSFTEYAPNLFSGTAISEAVVTYSAGTLDYAGDGVWVNVNGKLKTEKIIITDGAQAGYVLGCLDTDGNTGWVPSSGGGTGATFFNYWVSGASGTNSVKVTGTAANSTGTRSVALGVSTASGTNTLGLGTSTASATNSFAMGSGTTASGNNSASFGADTIASGIDSLAIGKLTIAGGLNSFAGGGSNNNIYAVQALGDYSFNFSRALSANSIADNSGIILGGLNNNATGVIIGGSSNNNYSNTECVIIGGSNCVITGSTLRSTILGGESNVLDSAIQSSIIGGSYNVISNLSQVVILGGSNITATTNNTVYVPALTIKNVGSGPSTVDIGVNTNGDVVNVSSDERLKENISTITNALDKVLNLRGVTYNWKDRENGGDFTRIGFIAQEVEPIVPELTFTGQDEYMGVHYGNITALLVEAIKELTSNEYYNSSISTETVIAEDNNIELNFNGTHESANDGGIKILKGVSNEIDSEIKIDDNGDWEFNPNIKIKKYTPTNSSDNAGNIGNVCYDDDYYYIKTINGWKRSNLESF